MGRRRRRQGARPGWRLPFEPLPFELGERLMLALEEADVVTFARLCRRRKLDPLEVLGVVQSATGDEIADFEDVRHTRRQLMALMRRFDAGADDVGLYPATTDRMDAGDSYDMAGAEETMARIIALPLEGTQADVNSLESDTLRRLSGFAETLFFAAIEQDTDWFYEVLGTFGRLTGATDDPAIVLSLIGRTKGLSRGCQAAVAAVGERRPPRDPSRTRAMPRDWHDPDEPPRPLGFNLDT